MIVNGEVMYTIIEKIEVKMLNKIRCDQLVKKARNLSKAPKIAHYEMQEVEKAVTNNFS